MSVLKAFRLPETLVAKLSKIAKENHRSEKFYVEEALRHYFADYVDAQIAKDRFNDPKSKIISSKELRGRLGV
ncbi:MAG: hypothetical protein H6755_03895 [Candidatus Omnitrophica bacterium]|nr:hypothetical protein [Candidatus Omnitrophota bacterium]